MYTLYTSPGTCSMAVHVVLNELGVPFETKKVSLANGDTKTPEYLKMNPRGAVPVLIDGGHVVLEGAAQMVYLLDKHLSVLLPSTGTARATALEWLMFGNATMHPAYGKLFSTKRMDDKAMAEYVKKEAVTRINGLWKDVEARLQKSAYLCGDECTVGDILLTVIANWSAGFPEIEVGPNARKLFKKVITRPAFQRTLEEEAVEYKMAA